MSVLSNLLTERSRSRHENVDAIHRHHVRGMMLRVALAFAATLVLLYYFFDDLAHLLCDVVW